MSKGNTWQKQKIAKHRANIRREALGGYAQGAPNPAKEIGADRRDGGMKPVHFVTPEVIGPFVAKNVETFKVITCEVGSARGLSKDIGRVGKAGRVLKKATRVQREHYSLRNLNGILKGCFSTTGIGEFTIYNPK